MFSIFYYYLIESYDNYTYETATIIDIDNNIYKLNKDITVYGNFTVKVVERDQVELRESNVCSFFFCSRFSKFFAILSKE